MTNIFKSKYLSTKTSTETYKYLIPFNNDEYRRELFELKRNIKNLNVPNNKIISQINSIGEYHQNNIDNINLMSKISKNYCHEISNLRYNIRDRNQIYEIKDMEIIINFINKHNKFFGIENIRDFSLEEKELIQQNLYSIRKLAFDISETKIVNLNYMNNYLKNNYYIDPMFAILKIDPQSFSIADSNEIEQLNRHVVMIDFLKDNKCSVRTLTSNKNIFLNNELKLENNLLFTHKNGQNQYIGCVEHLFRKEHILKALNMNTYNNIADMPNMGLIFSYSLIGLEENKIEKMAYLINEKIPFKTSLDYTSLDSIQKTNVNKSDFLKDIDYEDLDH